MESYHLPMIFTTTLLTDSVVLTNIIEMLIKFSEYMGYIGFYLGLNWIEYRVGKLGEYVLAISRFHATGICHGPVTVVDNELFLGINRYILINTCFGAVNSLACSAKLCNKNRQFWEFVPHIYFILFYHFAYICTLFRNTLLYSSLFSSMYT